MTKEDVPSRPSLIGRKRPQDAYDHVGRLGPIPGKARPQQLNGGTEPVTQSHGCLAAVYQTHEAEDSMLLSLGGASDVSKN